MGSKCAHCNGTGKSQSICCFWKFFERKPNLSDGINWEVPCCCCKGSGNTTPRFELPQTG